jgi:hypothetical protein
VVGDPALHLAQRVPARPLGRELGAELSLAAGPLDEDDELPGDRPGRLSAQILLDHGHGEVHARRDPG